jgi:hypothetical protein
MFTVLILAIIIVAVLVHDELEYGGKPRKK